MARALQKLTAKKIEKAGPGWHGDGGGLWLQVSPTESRSWIFRYMRKGEPKVMGLGSARDVSLALARVRAAEQRRILAEGLDPLQERDRSKLSRKLNDAKAQTFKQCAKAYIEAKRAGWKNAKHAEQWTNTLATYAYPVIGDLAVQDVDTDLVMRVLEPIWQTKTETASRVRSRIELILNSAKTRKLRSGDNPARWRGHLDDLLAKPSDIRAVEHHPALPFAKIPEFMAELRKQDGIAPRALELTILSAVRSNETLGAKPEEFHLDDKLWVIPAHRMKGKKKTRREHRVPLTTRAEAIVREMLKFNGPYLFPGGKEGKPLSNGAMPAVLERMKYTDITVHGFRSTFRDWASETTNYPNEVCEMALAHVIGDATEEAYRRGDLFTKRVRLMEDWAKFCGRAESGAVVAMPRKSA
jgi:integrase